MRQIKLTISAFIVLVVMLSGTASANIIYTVNNTVGAGGITGTIETDGTIGVLGAGNLLDWNLTLSDGIGTFNLLGPGSGGANSNALIFGSSFMGTLTDLLFDFSNNSGDLVLLQNPSNGSGMNWWCLEGTANGCSGNPSSENIRLQGPVVVGPRSGTQSVASVISVPEPGTLALLGIGLFGMGLARRKKA